MRPDWRNSGTDEQDVCAVLPFPGCREKAGEFDVLHGHDWHPVNVLCRIKAVRAAICPDLPQHGMGAQRKPPRRLVGSKRDLTGKLGGYEASDVITTSEF